MLCNGNLVEHHHLFQYFSSQGDFQVIEEGTWQGLETPHINCDQVKQLVECPFLTKQHFQPRQHGVHLGDFFYLCGKTLSFLGNIQWK